jgi:hypothetical protein
MASAPPVLSRSTHDTEAFFRQLKTVVTAKHGVYAAAAMYFDEVKDNPLSSKTHYDKCILESARREKGFPATLPPSYQSDKQGKAAMKEDEESLEKLQKPFFESVASTAQLVWFTEIRQHVDAELCQVVDNFCSEPMGKEHAGTELMVHLFSICSKVNQQTTARDVAKAVRLAQELATAPTKAASTITSLSTTARQIGDFKLSLPRFLTLLVCMSLNEAGSNKVSPQYLRAVDDIIDDEDKELDDLQREFSSKIAQGISISPSGKGGAASKSYAGAAASDNAAKDTKKSSSAPWGCRRIGGHLCCRKCGQRVPESASPTHTKETCPVDIDNPAFVFGKNFPLLSDASAPGVGNKRAAASGLAPHDLRHSLPFKSAEDRRVVQARLAVENGQNEFIDDDGNIVLLERDLKSKSLLMTMKVPENYLCPSLLRPSVCDPSGSHDLARAWANPLALVSTHPQSATVPESNHSWSSVLLESKHSEVTALSLTLSPALHQGPPGISHSGSTPFRRRRGSHPAFFAGSAGSTVSNVATGPRPVFCQSRSQRFADLESAQPTPMLADNSKSTNAGMVVIDSGAEEHVCPSSDGPTTPTNIVIQGISASVSNVRRGPLRVSTTDVTGSPCQLDFHKALIHPDLDFTLISVHRLLEADYKVTFLRNGGTIVSPSGVVVPLFKTGGLWTISSTPPSPSDKSGSRDGTVTSTSTSSTRIPSSPNPFAALTSSVSIQDNEERHDKEDTVEQQSVELQLHIRKQQQLAQDLHNRFDHCDRARLVRIAKHMSPHDPTRPDISTCVKFSCPSCSTMASKRPSARIANPSRSVSRGFFPGEFLHIDCTGSLDQTVTTVCGSVDVFAVTDDTSCARFGLPTTSATTTALVEALQRFQAKSMVKLRRLQCDGALAAGALTTWCLENNIDLTPSPPNEPRSNGRAESLVNLMKTKMRVMRQTSGAGIPFVYLIMSWAAMHSNFLPTSTDSESRPPVDIWPDLPFRHRELRHDVPWGCRAWRHEGKDYQNRPNWQLRARPCIFVGWSMSSPSYLLYDLESYRIFEGTYVTFDTENFPLLDMQLAGEAHTADKQIDIDGWRVAANTLIDSADDITLAHWCAGKQLVLELPSDFYPSDSPHRWIMQCISVPQSRKTAATAITLRTVGFTGPHDAISDPDDKTYITRSRLFDLVITGSSSSAASLRRALSFTFPTAVKLYDLALQNFTRAPRPPGHPRLLMDDPSAFASDTSIPSDGLQSTPSPTTRPRRSVARRPTPPRAVPLRSSPRLRAARRAGVARIPACTTPGRGTHFVSPNAHDEPATLRDARRGKNWPEWEGALYAEIDGVLSESRGTIERVHRKSVPVGHQLLHGMYVFKRKADGTAKVRLVVQGHRQRPMPTTSERFTSTPTHPALRAFYSVANQNCDNIDHLDVTQAFCQSEEFPDDVHLYMVPPALAESDPDIIWRLRRPLYGLTTAPKLWADTLKHFLEDSGWSPVAFEDCIWTKSTPSGYRMLLYVFVDDILISYSDADRDEAVAWKQSFLNRFEAKDLGPVKRFLGVNVERDWAKGTLRLHQTDYIQDLLERFGLESGNPVSTPLTPHVSLSKDDSPDTPDPILGSKYREVVGALTWLATATRPDLAHATAVLGAFSSNPGQAHWNEVFHCLRYLINTFDLGITYTRDAAAPSPNMQNHLFGFCDADWAACVDTRRSIGAYVLFLNGGAIAWRSKKQTCIAHSTCESEWMAASDTALTVLWLRRILHDMGASQSTPTCLYEDNAACIMLSENTSHKGRARHIDLRVHSLRDHVRNGVVRLVACPTFDMTADLLTKALPSPSFYRHRDVIFGNAAPTAPSIAPVLAFTARIARTWLSGV